jgi:hypothetical protein
MEISYGVYSVPVVREQLPEGFFGEFTLFPYPVIRVNEGLEGVMLTSTILHEVLEMVSSVHGLNLKESEIRTLEVSLMGLFHQNPWFAKRLLEPITAVRGSTPPKTLMDSPEAL